MIQCAVLLAGMLVAGEAEEAISNLPTRISAKGDDYRSSEPGSRPSARDPRVPAIPATRPVQDPSSSRTQTAPPRRITPRSHEARFGKEKSSSEENAGENDRESESDADKKRVAPSSRRMTWWITTAIGLAVVLAVIFTAGRALRAFVPGLGAEDPSGPIHVLHRTFITPKQSACLIRCGDRLLLVGLSGDRMQTLTEITDPKEIDFLKGACMQVRPRSTTRAFRDLLGKGTASWSENADDQEEVRRSSGPSFAAPVDPDKPSASQVGDFARQLQSVRERLFARKAGAGP